MKKPSAQHDFSAKARLRLGELFNAFETHHESPYVSVITLNQPDSLTVSAARIVQRSQGIELKIDRYDVKGSCRTADVSQLLLFVTGVHCYLSQLEASERVVSPGGARAFADEVNAIARDDEFPLHFEGFSRGWTPRVSSDAEALRCALLGNPADVAECKRGDPQVETVVSTLQGILARQSPVIVDYGVGLGRVLSGFETANRFTNAIYVAVDDPIDPQVRAIGKTLGAKFQTQQRAKFLENPMKADAIILLNTLHHIPFSDLPRQMSLLLASLKDQGVLLVHEINELREPEQINVPWEAEDIAKLFDHSGCVTNSRTMQTRSQRIPLTNMLVHLEGDPPTKDTLTRRCVEIWSHMKIRTLGRIKSLYERGDPQLEVELQHALITNANLDLNKP